MPDTTDEWNSLEPPVGDDLAYPSRFCEGSLRGACQSSLEVSPFGGDRGRSMLRGLRGLRRKRFYTEKRSNGDERRLAAGRRPFGRHPDGAKTRSQAIADWKWLVIASSLDPGRAKRGQRRVLTTNTYAHSVRPSVAPFLRVNPFSPPSSVPVTNVVGHL